MKRILAPGLALSLLLTLTFVPAPPAAADQLTVSLVHVIETSKWSPPSPDPLGLAYLPSTRQMIVVDSEVEETKLFDGANVWITNLAGDVKRSFSTTAYTNEPTDVATGRSNKVLFISDDNQDSVFIVKRGPDRTIGTADDRVHSFPTRSFHAADPQGLVFAEGDLLVANGQDNSIPAIYRVNKGANGRYDGAPPAGDDVVTKFLTAPLGLKAPEDLAYDPQTKHLFIVSRTEKLIAETTLDGQLVNLIDIAFTGIQEPSGIAFAPGSTDRSVQHIYVSDRGLDNEAHPGENDGLIVELAVGTGPPDSERPAAPTGVTVTPLSTGLALSWAHNTEPDIAGYNVFRSKTATHGYRKLNRLLLTKTRVVDTHARAGATSFYRVVAVDTSGNASPDAEVSGDRGVIAFRGASARKAASVDRLTIPRPEGVSRGVVLVGSVALRGSQRVDPPAGWDLVELQRKGRRLLQAVYVKVAARGEPGSYTWTFPRAQLAAGGIVAYEGVATGHPVDRSAGRAGAASTRIVAPSVSASTPMELLVDVFGSAASALVAPPAGMIEQAESRLARGSRGITVEISDDVLEAAGATGKRLARASERAVNVGQALLLRPRS